MKKVAVLFSGGLDSTYLVWKNLKDGNEVFPVYIEIENNEVKSKLEKNRTKLLWREFENEFRKTDVGYGDSPIKDIQYSVSVGVKAREDSLYFKQMPIWIFSLMFMQSMNVDEIQIGYVSNDDAVSYINDIKKIYKSYQPICETMKPLVFPITKMKKWQMFQELPIQYRKLIFSCENARIIGDENAEVIEYEPCCECAACKTVMSDNYYSTNNFPENYKKNLLRYYVNEIRKFDYKVVDEDGVDFFSKMYEEEMVRLKPEQLSFNFDCEIEYKTEVYEG